MSDLWHTNHITIVVLLLVFLLGLALHVSSVANTHTMRASDQPFSDDAFYYFSLAQNIADGKGLKVDDVHVTTGFQPLWAAAVVDRCESADG